MRQVKSPHSAGCMAWKYPPAGSAQRAARSVRNGVGREAVEVLRLRIEVRITRQNLPLAIDENFLGLQVRRNLRLKNSIRVTAASRDVRA